MRTAIGTAALAALTFVAGCGDDDDIDAVDDEVEDVVDDDTEETDESTTSTTDDVLPPPEPADFDTLDANGDSYLDGDEVAEWVDDEGTFQEWDIDLDSELDADEITENAFDLFDADGDGSVTEAEWQQGTNHFYPDGNTTVFADWDSDGDSELDADEFGERFDVSTLGESWLTEPMHEDLFRTAYFELYDRDQDGQVTETEWDEGAFLYGTPAE